MTIFNVGIMAALILLGKLFFGLSYSIENDYYDAAGNPTNRLIHYTILFETFVFLNLFNEINARKLGA